MKIITTANSIVHKDLFKFGFFVNDGGTVKEIHNVKEALDIVRNEMFNGFKKGVDDVMKGRVDVKIEGNIITLAGPKENNKNIIGAGTTPLSPYEHGRFVAESYFRSTDLDPTTRDTFYEEDDATGRVEKFSRQKILEWVISKKLPRDFAEWNKVMSLDPEGRAKELDRIVYRVARHMFEGK